ncbi:MAG TPA: hypothetical protein VE591_06275 [Candidatus Acidoferrum sp.]|nr:hypothetical protein [Candidatus Acidoferrum sp.]
MRRRALLAMAWYYIATGAWPLLSMESFEAITGPKRDHWLVNTVGALAVANGLTLLTGAQTKRIPRETIVLAVASACAFTTIDVVYVMRRCISPIYLADAGLELALVGVILRGN